MQETQLYPRAISWKISVTPLGKYRPQTFSPDISRVHCPPNLPPLLFPTSTGNLNFNLTTSDGLDPAGGARLNFKWEVSPGQRPRDKNGGAPPFATTLLLQPPDRTSTLRPNQTHLQFLARGSHAGRVITRRYYTERSFPSKSGARKFRGDVIHLYLCVPLFDSSRSIIFHSFINLFRGDTKLLDFFSPRRDGLKLFTSCFNSL